MKRLVLLAAMTGIAAPVAARPTLVCRITAWIPYTSAIKPGFDNTRVFTQDAALVEERQSGNAVVRRWTVIADTPAQLVAIDTGRRLTLTIDRPGNRFAESGVMFQRRGYCTANDLP